MTPVSISRPFFSQFHTRSWFFFCTHHLFGLQPHSCTQRWRRSQAPFPPVSFELSRTLMKRWPSCSSPLTDEGQIPLPAEWRFLVSASVCLFVCACVHGELICSQVAAHHWLLHYTMRGRDGGSQHCRQRFCHSTGIRRTVIKALCCTLCAKHPLSRIFIGTPLLRKEAWN